MNLSDDERSIIAGVLRREAWQLRRPEVSSEPARKRSVVLDHLADKLENDLPLAGVLKIHATGEQFDIYGTTTEEIAESIRRRLSYATQ